MKPFGKIFGGAFKQDLSKEQSQGSPFIIYLLSEKKLPLPEKDCVLKIMTEHLGSTEIISHKRSMISFAAKKYTAQYKDAALPPMLSFSEFEETNASKPDGITVSQMWDCPEKEDILAKCKYKAVAMDMLAAGLPYKERADMLMDFTDGLLGIFPECRAVMFDVSGKMFSRKDYLERNVPRENRYVFNAVNVRFFKIQGTNDMLVDTLGMSTLCLPDLQYHFHTANPDDIINHAYNLLSYIYACDCPVKNGESIDGMKDGEISRDVRWICRVENSLIQPKRPVIDVNMGELAAWDRRDF